MSHGPIRGYPWQHATFTNEHEPLHDVSCMGTDQRVGRQAQIVFAGFCCKPFSPVGKVMGFEDPKHGNNFTLLVTALKERRERGVSDACILLENVPNVLKFLTTEHLASLGYHTRVYVVSGAHFRCANMRERCIIIGFLEPAHCKAFTPPPPQSRGPTPLRNVLKRFTIASSSKLFLGGEQIKQVQKHSSHVVGRGYPLGARSPTSFYGANSPGTLIAEHAKFDASTKPLTPTELKQLSYGDVRKVCSYLATRSPSAVLTACTPLQCRCCRCIRRSCSHPSPSSRTRCRSSACRSLTSTPPFVRRFV
jgi:site-specific DNA-cytosine methylase